MRIADLAVVSIVALAFAARRRSGTPPAPREAPAATPPVQAAPPPGPSAGAAAKSVARVASVALGSALDANKGIAQAKSACAPTDTIYASVATQGWATPVTLTARWTCENGRLANETSRTVQPGPRTTECHIAKPDGWPAGSYQVEILADGATAATQRFEVR